MANSRFYSSIALPTTLTSGITASGTTMIVAATAGFPGSLPYTLAVDYGSSNEELVEVTGVAGTTLTVTRAIDNTTGSSHNPGAVVRHVSSARDFTDSRTHEAASTNVHGLSGGSAVVGTTSTQTLTNKTLTHALGSADNFKLYSGSGVTQIIGNSAAPTNNRLEILDDESALNTMVLVQSNGAIKSVKVAAEGSGSYKFRMTDNDATTDRFAVLAGGTITIAPTSATTFVGFDIVAPDTSTSKRAIRVAASGGGTERFTVWNDGRVDILGTDATFSQLDVTGAASQSASYMRVMSSGGSTLFSIQASGNTLANHGATIAQPGVTSGPVLQVGGSNVGYTGNLTQWVDPGNTIVVNIDQTGALVSSANITTTATVSGGAITATSSGNITTSTGKVVAGNLRAGTAQTPAPGSANLTTTVNVTFSSAMVGTPRVTVTPSSTAPDVAASGIRWLVDNESTTGFTIRCARTTLNATNFNYIAVVE